VARRCVFCGGSGLTLEHVIPQWLSRHVLEVTGGNGFSVSGAIMRGRRRVPIIDAQVKRACESCNTGWMHDLEEDCREAIAAMIDGVTVDMGPRGQTQLGRWAIKTAAMVEFTTPARTFSGADRAELRGGSVPDGHTVLLARYAGSRMTGGRISYAPLVYEEAAGSTTLYAFTMQVAQFVVQVIGSGKVGGFVLDVVGHGAVEREAAIRIVPGDTPLAYWPPRFVLDDSNYELFEKLPLPKS
jgi:hypothetical protein